MPRNYKPDPRGKQYKKHSEEDMKKAIAKIRSGLSIREAARQSGIPNSVLRRHYKIPGTLPQGGPTALSIEEENVIVERLLLCSKWGYPMDRFTFRLFVKSYLDCRGKKVKQFKDNTPGNEFVTSFLKRHKNKLAERMCQNIKRARAQVSREIVQKYFDNLKIELEGVPANNVVNYDETNLQDDPGRKKIITKRGCKYPERVMNSSKSAHSIMVAATAEGNLLPLYVVYKASHLYDTWVEGGPEKARYNRSKSGWFDGVCFEDWIKKIIIPHFRNVDGPKVLIGDNLSCHLSTECVRLCEQNNIKMVFLPSNSTHIAQPLDVSFFHPMKVCWRAILQQWKSGPGRKEASVPKDVFPSLLKRLVRKLQDNCEKNIKNGFAACGILPFCPEAVLKRIPDKNQETSEEINSRVDQTLINLLEEMRGVPSSTPRRKKRKLNAEPGKSVSVETSSDSENSEEIDNDVAAIENEENLGEGSSQNEDLEGENVNESCPSESSENSNENELVDPESLNENESAEPYELNKGDFIIVKFKTNKRERRFIAQVLNTNSTQVEVKFLRKKIGQKNTYFVFPMVEDVAFVNHRDVERRIVCMSERRGQYMFCVNSTYLE